MLLNGSVPRLERVTLCDVRIGTCLRTSLADSVFPILTLPELTTS
jgi:hypothetical protein